MDEAVSKALDSATTLVQSAAAKMAELAPEVWKILVWQSVAEGISTIISSLMIFAVVFTLQRNAPKLFTPQPYDESSWDNEQFYLHTFATKALPSVILFFTTLLLVNDIRTGLLKIINPHYYAILTLTKVAQ